MKIHELNATSKKDKKRVGRGISAGQCKTAGRGTKGQKAKSIRATRSPARPPKGGPPLAGKDPKRVITMRDKSTSNDG